MQANIFLSIPTHRYIEPETLNNVTAHMRSCPYPIEYHSQRGSPNIYMQHANSWDAMKKTNCTHYLWWDSDQTIESPEDAIKILVENNKPIISPLIVKRKFPHFPACITEKQSEAVKNGTKQPYEDFRVYGERIFKIKYCSGGVVLIKREVLEAVESKYYENPFYALVSNGKMYGVDIGLYQKASLLGFQCWINPTIKVAHWGFYPFMIDDYYSILDGGGLK